MDASGIEPLRIQMVVANSGCYHQLHLATLQQLAVAASACSDYQHVGIFDIGSSDGGTTKKDDLVSKLTDRLSDIGYLVVNNYLHDSSLHDA